MSPGVYCARGFVAGEMGYDSVRGSANTMLLVRVVKYSKKTGSNEDTLAFLAEGFGDV